DFVGELPVVGVGDGVVESGFGLPGKLEGAGERAELEGECGVDAEVAVGPGVVAEWEFGVGRDIEALQAAGDGAFGFAGALLKENCALAGGVVEGFVDGLGGGVRGDGCGVIFGQGWGSLVEGL